MSRVLALVEGPTEREFVRNVLAPHLGRRGVYLYPRVVGKPGHKGGVRSFDAVLRELIALARQEPLSVCTTMFDYSGMPPDWPGVADARGRSFREIPEIVEGAIAERLVSALGDSADPRRFIPYVQMHEFEALLFADPQRLAVSLGRPDLACRFQQALDECGDCEAINDRPGSYPSQRITAALPSFQKVTMGVLAGAHIGLDRIRCRCRHFDQWLRRLESLASGG